VANLYGVAEPNPPPQNAFPIGGSNVVCPANVETNFTAIPLTPATSRGFYYPSAVGIITFTCGATPPGSVNWGVRIGAGADIFVLAQAPQTLIANAVLTVPLLAYCFATAIADPFGPTTLNITANPSGQPITVLQFGNMIYGSWVRAPDQ
jgi:hypothetical protein